MALLILAILQRIFLMLSLLLLLVWLMFFIVFINLFLLVDFISGYITSSSKNISNVVTYAAFVVVDIFHCIDKAVADTWNNFWKDGKADGIGSNLSRK